MEKLQRDFLTCPVCWDTLKDPRILPCTHRYCLLCIKDLVGRGGHSLQCPLDRRIFRCLENEVHLLTKDYTISGLIEGINKMQEEAELTEKRRKLCSVHKSEDITFYCKTCSSTICQRCATTIHQKHQFETLQESWKQELQPLVTGILHTGEQRLQQLGEQKAILDKTYNDQVENFQEQVNKVKQKSEMFKAIIDEQTNKQILELEKNFSTAIGPWDEALSKMHEKEEAVFCLKAEIGSLPDGDPWVIDQEGINEFKVKLDNLSSRHFTKDITQTPPSEYNAMLYEEEDSSLYTKFMNTFGPNFKVKHHSPSPELQRDAENTKEGYLINIPSGFETVTDLVVTPSGRIAVANGRMLKIFELSRYNKNTIVHKKTIAIPTKILDVFESEILAATQYSISYISDEGESLRTNDMESKNENESIVASCMAVDGHGGTYIGVHPIQLFATECSANIYKIWYQKSSDSVFREWRIGYGSIRSMCCTQEDTLVISLYKDKRISIQILDKFKCYRKFTLTMYEEMLPCPVACNEHGAIYVVDNARARVIKLTSCGDQWSYEYILTREDGFEPSTAVSVSKSVFNKLFLGHENGNLSIFPLRCMGENTTRRKCEILDCTVFCEDIFEEAEEDEIELLKEKIGALTSKFKENRRGYESV